MKKSLIAGLLLALFLSYDVQAQNIEVATLEIGTTVEDRNIVNPDTSFSSSVGNLFCFTRITGAEDTTQVSHVWYYDDEEMARTELDVRSSDWRTWSSKNILPTWVGSWRVVIEDAGGNSLTEQTFEIVDDN